MNYITGTQKNFKSEVQDYSGLVLVDFWASWCGPCQMMTPIIEEISAELKDELKIVKVDVDVEVELASQFNITAIPAIYIYKQGKIVGNLVGFHQKQDILSIINN